MIIFLGNGHSLDKYSDFIKTTKNDRDIVVSCQYPFRVPQSLLKTHTCVNIHYGVLPYYGGCNPIYWQVLRDDSAGATVHYMDEDFDTGDIIATDKFPISGMTADEVYKDVEDIAYKMFVKLYPKIIDGTANRTKQDKIFMKYYPRDAVDFSSVCRSKKEVLAKFFPSKQLPKIEKDGVVYEISRIISGL